ncbi:YcaO-like family protein [Streptomyces sp. NPDC088348]|uniref:YcaO-like family protein n=1 Tax=Streptomyces sp. NPDC088348 TaxID=3365853 RepID=UPI00380B70B9
MSPWTPQVFTPCPDHPDVLLGRVAARSAAFEGTSAAGGARVIVGSAAGHEREQVARSARGELLERVGNVMAGRAAEAAAETVATHGELRRRGLAALAPPGLPDSRRLWVRGRTVAGAETYVAAGAVFLQHRPPPGCDTLPSTGSTGIAAHPDAASAARHAAWEVLERDLVRRSWYGLTDRAPRMLDAGPAGPLGALIEDRGLTATAFALPAPPGAECVVVALHRPDGTGQTFGARCGPPGDVAALVEKAAYEALMVRWSMHTVTARGAWEEWRGETPPTTAVQHALWAYYRQDSLSLWDVARTQARDRADPVDRTGQPDRADPVGRTDRTGPAGRAGPPRSNRPADPLAVLAGHTGQDVILVETSTKSVRSAGVRVVRVIAPGALPLPSGHVPGPGRSRPHPFG